MRLRHSMLFSATADRRSPIRIRRAHRRIDCITKPSVQHRRLRYSFQCAVIVATLSQARCRFASQQQFGHAAQPRVNEFLARIIESGSMMPDRDEANFDSAVRLSPCVRDCRLDRATRFCIGCGRTSSEIARWLEIDDAQRRTILEKLPSRLQGRKAKSDEVIPRRRSHRGRAGSKPPKTRAIDA